VEEEVRVRHSGSSRRRQSCGERAMGDDGGEGGTSNVEYCSVDGEEGIDEENVNGSFIIDRVGAVGVQVPSCTPSLETSVDESLYYTVDWDTVLGEAEAPPDSHERACFNCGSPSHLLSACPEPLDRARMAVARSAFAEMNDYVLTRRIHHVGEDQARRLQFLDRFKPGQIQSPVLRDALGLDDHLLDSRSRLRRIDELPWYHGMMKWGYPPGYSSVRDTFEVIRKRILGEDEMGDFISGPLPLAVYDDADTGELGAFGSHHPPVNDVHPPPELMPPLSPTSPCPRRWVDFPTTMFKSSLLPVSTVYVPLPPLTPEPRRSATFTQDRQQLWRRIVSGNTDASPTKPASRPLLPPGIPPWRQAQRGNVTESLVRIQGDMEENEESDMNFSD